jgi:2,4-dienoyl-CoA reductase-like NADH-dependent reductase (Old Yellow Enzyme family)
MPRGHRLKNRMILAPLTNLQSHPDGTASDDDLAWIARSASNGYSMVMTCAANIQAIGQAFPGQLGVYDDKHMPGLARMADVIKQHGSVSSIQLHHGGMRGGLNQTATPVGPSANAVYGARALSTDEVRILRDDFITAAKRAERAGFDGVEVHAAFGWILSQFLSPTLNQRIDQYGGSPENRARLIFEIIDGIRASAGANFQIGLRLSMERYGMRLEDIRAVADHALKAKQIDYLDLAPWDTDKIVAEGPYRGQKLLDLFTSLPRGNIPVGASGKIMSAAKAASVLAAGCDFVMIGRAAILKNDFPAQAIRDPNYQPPSLPVTEEYLRGEGLSSTFIQYMRQWDGFVAA